MMLDINYDLLSRREREELYDCERATAEMYTGLTRDCCAYCAAHPALGEPPQGQEPQCLFCWDTGIELSDSERERRISALPANAIVRVA